MPEQTSAVRFSLIRAPSSPLILSLSLSRACSSVSVIVAATEATSKAILKLMDSDGSTIFHCNSSFQKYRIAKYVPDSTECKYFTLHNALFNVSFQLVDRQLGLSLYEVSKIRWNLQMGIEEQGRQLKIMLDQQQKTRLVLYRNQNSGHPDGPSLIQDDVQVSSEEESRNNFHPR
ncbi:hypothetical protein Cgig2_024799 [Carnegiea gigantea]|uniref:Uncharacterized protein n=1 Tax=Carnegiea gigantea TaxID=171969 RepID=A0A9Q1K3K4_9CARY|nr:hypothetical protein Cgig2_024799 [Carnegiea gigantea]